MPKFIIVTGGVLSGLGKGIAAASIGHLLSENYKVVPIKLDGYLNVDPGTMNPIEHGEVFVLDDGGEVDMDFGHYERYLNITCKSKWNLTMGKIFQEVREKERAGDYLGKTVQFIPHVVNLIKSKFLEISKEEDADITLIEVGGTIGDIENELYIEAVKQLKKEVGQENILYVHLTYIPIPTSVNEQKSKPTQQSINLLRSKGIEPDIVIGRCSQIIEDKIKEKISIFGGIKKEAVITGLDVDCIYEIPLIFYKEGILDIINKRLNLDAKPSLKWKELTHNLKSPKKEINIAIAGKYTKLADSYASIKEALNHCTANLSCKINLDWIETTDLKKVPENIHGVIVPGGFGSRGFEGKIKIIEYARKNKIPFLGLCLGMQLAVIEHARNVSDLKNANTTEVNPNTDHPIIDLLPEQKQVYKKGGTMRLGGHNIKIKENTKAHQLLGNSTRRRFRHRYEINPKYLETLEKNSLIISGKAQNQDIAQIIELKDHPFFMATQSHPELTSKLETPDPFFLEFIKSALKIKKMQHRVLIIGSGGREHALAWKLKQSEFVEKIYCAPGNDSMKDVATIIPYIKPDDFENIANFVKDNNIALTIVGPEIPLVKGIVDYFHKNKLVEQGYLIFGPSEKAAQLEGNKAFAKEFMKKYNIPTADFKTFTNPDKAKLYIWEKKAPIVVKASGLAAGKGVIVCQTIEQGLNAIDKIMVKKEFGESGNQVVIEEFIQGEEASILALTDGKTIRTLISSQDHKRVFDDDKGENTGGMGAYAPAPIVTPELLKKVYEKILAPTIQGMQKENIPFKGCLYAGLIIKDNEPKVIEYNVRLGDPEAQPVLSLLESDLFLLLKACIKGNLNESQIKNKPGAACCVVMASGGYPGKYKKGKIISGLDQIKTMKNIQVFHAGTKIKDNQFVTNSGRVLGVTGLGENIQQAINNTYQAVNKISWENLHYRKDIGKKAL